MATVAKKPELDFNPLSKDFWNNPYPFYERLREQNALFVPDLNSWWVGRFDDVKALANDMTGTFSHKKFQEVALGEFDFAPDSQQLISSDPPDHSRLRQLANQGFKPRRLKLLEDSIHQRIETLIDGLLAQPDRRFDFMHDFADVLPISVVTDLLGADPNRCEEYRAWTRTIMTASSRATMSTAQHAVILSAVNNAREYFGSLIQHYKNNPGENIISDLIAAQDNDDRLTDGEIRALAILLVIGGDETTGHLMGNLLTQLSMHPEQYALLKAEPHRIADAIDESLRFWAPVQTAFMFTTREATVGDAVIPPDSAVIACWGSANRDPDHCDRPDEFDITRKKQGHLAFGSGPHFCVGNMLARQEATAAFKMIFEKMPNLRVDDFDKVEWYETYWMRGPKSLPVVF